MEIVKCPGCGNRNDLETFDCLGADDGNCFCNQCGAEFPITPNVVGYQEAPPSVAQEPVIYPQVPESTADRLAEFCGLRPDYSLDGLLCLRLPDGELITRQAWDPEHDRNQLAIVLEACREKGLVFSLSDKVEDAYDILSPEEWAATTYAFWLLTAPPAVICQAVVAVLDERGL